MRAELVRRIFGRAGDPFLQFVPPAGMSARPSPERRNVVRVMQRTEHAACFVRYHSAWHAPRGSTESRAPLEVPIGQGASYNYGVTRAHFTFMGLYL